MSDVKEKLSQLFENYKNEFVELNEYLYNNPELGLHEFKACAAHTAILEKYGFNVTKNFAGLETAFQASFKNSTEGPRIAILAEYDALPGIGHGCGHNIFGVTSIATGILVKELMKDIPGEILVIGTPAEETNGAKVDMAQKGVFNNIDIAMAVHPSGEAHYRSGVSQAMEALQFTFKGKTAHASGAPHEGINALDGVLMLFNSVNALRQQTLETARVHGIITKGGEAANIIPDLAVANFYVRAKSLEYLKGFVERVKNCAKGAALATGTTLEITNYETSFANLVTNNKLSETYEKNLKSLGVTDIRDKESHGSTDMGDVSHCCPTIHPYFPLTTSHLTGHSVEFASASIAPDAYKGMKEATLAMALTALELFENKELLNEIKEEFKNTKK
ncbi:M20 family metallopeptidase [Fusobacterium gastrosuis]|uniref:M20 family metallopeptidase n=1 Tax=Fusobacterium gastrosuis TaxID=1755100 RepID=UPI00297781D3|nr:M20 family metallopeptidase [Fusobacteriaceae bacterium]MDD7409628.1 M20 family metallopeptidase [Fusobacteriaceae bacterium]MDY5713343.1 M20 family metallopeptidase [Fusobacterium gastrosuis]MDY5794754.1 M20 family metallopeptidase [Fusobacterium gastrosuis]